MNSFAPPLKKPWDPGFHVLNNVVHLDPWKNMMLFSMYDEVDSYCENVLTMYGFTAKHWNDIIRIASVAVFLNMYKHHNTVYRESDRNIREICIPLAYHRAKIHHAKDL